MKLFRLTALAIAMAALVTASALDLPTRVINGKTYYYYEVKPKETVYSLTRQFGISREDLIKYNPQVQDGLRAYDTLLFPVDEMSENITPKPEAPVKEVVTLVDKEVNPSDIPTITTEPVQAKPQNDKESLNLAVVLPFMLESTTPSRSAEKYLNFYRGVLLAIDSLGSQSAQPLHIFAYDNEGTSERTAEIVSSPEFLTMDYIIAPDDSASIEQIALVADSTNAVVVNLFAVKNDAHERHESVLQTHIPHDLMYETAYRGFINANKDKNIVILHPTDSKNEKEEFVEGLTTALANDSIQFEQIDFSGKLVPAKLSDLETDREIVFVPTSHSNDVLGRILPTLTAFAANAENGVSLFGYPEWVVKRGEVKDQLHKLNTTIYSRFSTALDNEDAQRVFDRYKTQYGGPMDKGVPITALLGYDTTAWIISASKNGATEPYQGIQTSFIVKEIEGAGDVNGALYFINFLPSGQLEAHPL